MKKYLFSCKGWLSTYFVILIINQVLVVSVALLLKYVVDAIVEMNETMLFQFLYFALAFIVTLFAVEFLRRMCRAKYIQITILRIKKDVFAGILRKDISSFADTNSAEFISILNNDIKTVEDGYVSNILLVIQDVLMLVIAMAILFYLSPIVAIATVALTLLPLLIPTFFGRVLSTLQGRYMQTLGTYNEKIKDFFMGFEVIKTFKAEKKVQVHFDNANQKAELDKYKVNKANAFVHALGNMSAVGVQFSIFFVAGFFVLNGHLTVGAIVAVTQLSGNIVAPLMRIIQGRSLMKSVKLINHKLSAIISTESKNHSGTRISDLKFGIEFANVSFSYDSNRNAIEQFNFLFEKGKKYAIVGGSGSGKSTLLKLLLRYYEHYSGEIYVDKIENRCINLDDLYKICSIIHQNPFVFADTLKNNITMYNQFSDEEIEQVIKYSGLEDVVSRLELGVEEKIGESGNTLSGGEKQRIAIARALIKGSELMILDEATANLDNETAYDIENRLMDVQDLTCLLVTHRLNKELLKKCDKILVLKDGKLHEIGTYNQLIEQKGYFYRLFTVTDGGLIEQTAV